MLLFWTTNNIFSLLQMSVLRTSWAKEILNLPERVQRPASSGKVIKGGGFLDGIKQGMNFGEAQSSMSNNPYSNYGSAAGYARSGPAIVAAARKEVGGASTMSGSGREDALQDLLGSETSSASAETGSAASSARTHRGPSVSAQDILREDARAQKDVAKQKRIQAARDRRSNRKRI